MEQKFNSTFFAEDVIFLVEKVGEEKEGEESGGFAVLLRAEKGLGEGKSREMELEKGQR